MNAAKAFVNTWLKDKQHYCHNCDADFNPLDTNEDGHWNPCCEKPEVGTNWTHAYAVMKQNKARRKELKKITGANETDTMRYGISIPVRMYHDLNQYFLTNYKEKFLQEPSDLRDFMHTFKEFTIPEKV